MKQGLQDLQGSTKGQSTRLSKSQTCRAVPNDRAHVYRGPRPAGQYQTTEHTFIEVPVGEEKDRQKDEEIKAKNFPKSINGHK